MKKGSSGFFNPKTHSTTWLSQETANQARAPSPKTGTRGSTILENATSDGTSLTTVFLTRKKPLFPKMCFSEGPFGMT